MNALVKKEIRLLLPSWLTVLLVATLLPWVWKQDGRVINVSPAVLFFGAILIGVDVFGREFSLGTFSWLMSQPMERQKIWRNKITVLAVGVAILYIVQLASYEVWLHGWLPLSSGPHSYVTLGDDWRIWVGATALMLVAAAGGLWTTLLLRQVAAAMWIAFLAPVALVLLIVYIQSQMVPYTPDLVEESVFFGAAGLYIIAGFILARWLFYRAQDVGWTGGVITLPEWSGFSTRSEDVISIRKRRPIFALLKKEFQLQQVALTGAAGLLVLHIGVIVVRETREFARDSISLALAGIFWVLWLVMPPIIGSMAVAEERRLGVMEGQLCLPVSRRVQFAIKLVLTILLGTFFGGVMPMLVERVAVELGSLHSMFAPEYHPGREFGIFGFVELGVVALAAGLAFVCFYASTLARSFLQALGLAIATIVVCYLNIPWIANTQSFFGFGIASVSSPLLELTVAIPTLIVTLGWLACLNFTSFRNGWPLWRCNLAGMTGAALFIMVCSALIYNRAWEVFEPAEPPHGTPMFSLSGPPTLQGDPSGSLVARLPDGRVWFDTVGYYYLVESHPSRWKELWRSLVCPLPQSGGPHQFLTGSNWVSVTARHLNVQDPDRGIPGRIVGYWDTVGIQADGTLWRSEGIKSTLRTGARMIRLGDETNWRRVVRLNPGFLLLKKDGTLWQQGASRSDWKLEQSSWPSVNISKPQQFGTNCDWKEAFNDGTGYARKTDESTWAVHVDWSTGRDELKRKANLDQIVPQTFSRMADDRMAYVGKDGTLWASERTGSFLQCGKETNWVAVVVTWNCGVALKADGTLWKWVIPNSASQVPTIRQTRLGTHNDWVGLTGCWGCVVSLAADGSLWYWPSTGYFGVLLKAPSQPQLLANIFSDPH